MIEKERLQELIEQNAIVYYVASNEIYQLALTYKHNIYLTVEGYYICLYGNNGLQIYGDKLFESKEEAEDAEWHKEFGCIERTERLVLPTWEEFNEKKFVWFFDKDHKSCCLHYLGCSNQIFINVGGDVISIGDITKENYTLACRKAKALFLGENYEN